MEMRAAAANEAAKLRSQLSISLPVFPLVILSLGGKAAEPTLQPPTGILLYMYEYILLVSLLSP